MILEKPFFFIVYGVFRWKKSFLFLPEEGKSSFSNPKAREFCICGH